MQVKDYNKQGLLFFTNYNSKKAQQLEENPRAACNFYWDKLSRQVCMSGTAKKISREDSVKYFDKEKTSHKVVSHLVDKGMKYLKILQK